VVTQSTTSTALKIRAANWQDASNIYAFLCELEGEALNYTSFRAVFRHNLTNPSIHYMVAERDGDVVGFVSCHTQYLLHHCGKVGEIQECFVKPEYRNQKIGRQLMLAVEALAYQEGFINLEVTTNQKRQDTIRFYERESFNRTHLKLVKPIQY
jgi:PhnO protein